MDETIAIIDYEMKIARYTKTKITGDPRFRTSLDRVSSKEIT
jgi:hypothetical protein